MQDGDFKPLSLTTPGQAGTGVQTVGVPTETQFLTFHSLLLDAATPADVLVSPLPMSGAYTIPLDLTDFESFSRLQAGFKLTRTVARFDVINNATDSRFTITGISMGNARRGTTFFPGRNRLPQLRQTRQTLSHCRHVPSPARRMPMQVLPLPLSTPIPAHRRTTDISYSKEHTG